MKKMSDGLSSLFLDQPVSGKCTECNAETKSLKYENGFFYKAPNTCTDCQERLIRESEEKRLKEERIRVKIHQKNYKKISTSLGMPENLGETKKELMSARMKQVVKDMYNDLILKDYTDRSYIVYGSAGVGKSSMCAYLFMLLVHGFPVAEPKRLLSWVSLHDLYSQVKESFNNETLFTEASIVKERCLIPTILFFEMMDIRQEGKTTGGNVSHYLVNIIHKIVDYRWRYKNKRTVFILKVPAKQQLITYMNSMYDDSTVGRILENSRTVRVTGQDQRITNYGQKSIWEI